MNATLLYFLVICILFSIVGETYSAGEYDSLMNSGRPYTRDQLTRLYFENGYTAFEIVGFLLTCHSINLSIRHLRRILRQLHLRRADLGMLVIRLFGDY